MSTVSSATDARMSQELNEAGDIVPLCVIKKRCNEGNSNYYVQKKKLVSSFSVTCDELVLLFFLGLALFPRQAEKKQLIKHCTEKKTSLEVEIKTKMENERTQKRKFPN